MSDQRTWPPYLPNQLIRPNPDAQAGVVCCWTPREYYLGKLEEVAPGISSNIVALGQLYTQERGVDFLVRNLLANPRINRLVIGGNDRTEAGKALFHLFDGGQILEREDHWTLDQYPKVKIRKDIPREILFALPGTIQAMLAPTPEVAATQLDLNIPRFHREEAVFFDPPEPDVKRFPSNEHGHVIRGPDIPSVYMDLLHEIMTFGRETGTHYDQKQKELLDLVAVIADQNPNPQELPDFIPFDLDHLHAYIQTLTTDHKDPSVTYTYGNRIHGYFGTDQFKRVAYGLAKKPISRSEVISLWDPRGEGKGSPCLNHLWFRIRGIDLEGPPVLHMTALIRSNDMYAGWPENAYGLRALQEKMRCSVLKAAGEFQDGGLGLGELVIISESAHLYRDCWEEALAIAAGRKYTETWDRKGNWIISSLQGTGTVKAELVDPIGFTIWSMTGKPNAIRREITRLNLVSDIGHALYLGTELERAWRIANPNPKFLTS